MKIERIEALLERFGEKQYPFFKKMWLFEMSTFPEIDGFAQLTTQFKLINEIFHPAKFESDRNTDCAK